MGARGCLTVFVIFLVSLHGVLGQVASLCRPNERFLSCGGCQKTCQDPAPTCTAVCQEGCFCEEGEVRNGTGHCVKLSECPSIAAPTHLHTSEPRSTDTECPEDEEYRFCEPCNKTCDNPNPMCPAQCGRGCFCVEDLLRDRDGRCVRKDQCSNLESYSSNYIQPLPYKLTCGPHQAYSPCQECEAVCGAPAPVCSRPCGAGCFCAAPYFKAPSGQCVLLEDCPRAEIFVGSALGPSVEDCQPDEVFLQCGWCEPSCSAPRPACPAGCTRGCLCRPPLLRHYSGHCVDEQDCLPHICPDTEEYGCRYGCEARCDPRRCIQIRPRRCSLGCHCKSGLLRDNRGNCITPETCSLNKHYVHINATVAFRESNKSNLSSV